MRRASSSVERGLRRITLLVPESCAESVQDLARVLRARQRERTAEPLFGWRRISPSAEVMVDLRSGMRCAVRDRRVAGAARYHWTLAMVGTPEPLATGRASDIAAARSQAEAALSAYSTNECDH
jgi:hypothetical protein